MRPNKRLLCFFLVPLFSSCAVLHHAQVGDVDNTGKTKRFEIKVSELGVDVAGGARLAGSLSRNPRMQRSADKFATIWQLMNMGPRTGNPVFDGTYAEGLIDQIRKECPSGRVSSLTSIRETRVYPVISGEIVKVTGECLE